MIDSTNPRILANNIRKLLAKIIGLQAEIEAITPGSEVVANPEGEAAGNLSSLGIDGDKYNIPTYSPVDYSTTEYNTGKKWTDGRDVFGIVIHLASPLSLTGAWQSTGVPWSGSTIISNLTACPIGFGTYEGVLLVKGIQDTTVQEIVIEYVKDSVNSTRKKSTK